VHLSIRVKYYRSLREEQVNQFFVEISQKFAKAFSVYNS